MCHVPERVPDVSLPSVSLPLRILKVDLFDFLNFNFDFKGIFELDKRMNKREVGRPKTRFKSPVICVSDRSNAVLPCVCNMSFLSILYFDKPLHLLSLS